MNDQTEQIQQPAQQPQADANAESAAAPKTMCAEDYAALQAEWRAEFQELLRTVKKLSGEEQKDSKDDGKQ